MPIGCGGVAVYPGDVVVGDAEGVVVIPRGIADDVARESTSQTEFEDFVTEQVLGGRGIFGLYPPTDPAGPGAAVRGLARAARPARAAGKGSA